MENVTVHSQNISVIFLISFPVMTELFLTKIILQIYGENAEE